MQRQLNFARRKKTNLQELSDRFSIDEKSLFKIFMASQWSMMLITLFIKKLQKNIS
ncbi:hypothetical protein BSPWISOXPB_5413 [uncultured Gammaproteobacteria bacterium]|nr:hypothetical protein BSPWISOXPB_5413 [uncultured Gammaproteobacteria bacterium]